MALHDSYAQLLLFSNLVSILSGFLKRYNPYKGSFAARFDQFDQSFHRDEQEMTDLFEARCVTVPPIPEAKKPPNTSQNPHTETSPTEVAATYSSPSEPPITNKQRI
ncbi:hypothetical protein Rs2_28985 [Raphanus sativus]|nr:hypothetical protein Rs2_28985 [Raphanus sativus]